MKESGRSQNPLVNSSIFDPMIARPKPQQKSNPPIHVGGVSHGASEPSVHRALRQLRADGVVGTGYRRVIIRDLRTLHEIAGAAWTGTGS